MNIVVSTKSFLPMIGGTISYACMLATAFREAGHAVIVMTRTAGEPQALGDIPVVRKPTWQQKAEIAGRTDILLQIDSSWQDVLPFLWKRVPWFPTIHRGFPRVPITATLLWLKLQLERMGYLAGRTIGVSDYALKSWRIKGTCIGSSYRDDLFFPPAEGARRDIDLFFIGRMTHDKGALVMLEAIRKIARLYPGLLQKAYFAGLGPAFNEVKAGCEALQELDAQALGALKTSEDVADYLRRTKILVFPTTSQWLEASPIVPLEGLACGCYVVASDIGGTRENIGPKGFLVQPDDPEILASQIIQILKSPPSFDESEVRTFLEQRHVQPTASRYLKLFEDVLSQR